MLLSKLYEKKKNLKVQGFFTLFSSVSKIRSNWQIGPSIGDLFGPNLI